MTPEAETLFCRQLVSRGILAEDQLAAALSARKRREEAGGGRCFIGEVVSEMYRDRAPDVKALLMQTVLGVVGQGDMSFGEEVSTAGFATIGQVGECLDIQARTELPGTIGEIMVRKGYISWLEHEALLVAQETVRGERGKMKKTVELPTPGGVWGNYKIVACLGKGGMGTVYLAEQKQLGRQVALKVLPEALGDDPRAVERFKRETMALAKLQHPHICQVIEGGEYSGLHYYAMEYLTGCDLSEIIRTQRINHQRACRIAIQIADALQFAHDHGIIHRDVKPQNVIVTRTRKRVQAPDPRQVRRVSSSAMRLLARILGRSPDSTAAAPVPGEGAVDSQPPADDGPDSSADRPNPYFEDHAFLLDFGLAREDQGRRLTLSDEIIGTPAYAAPEQLAGRSDLIGPATDVYSLGVVLYEMVSTHVPFESDSVPDTIHMACEEEPVPLRRLRPETPFDLEVIAMKCLEKDPKRRYESADELRGDLECFLAGEPISARPPSTIYRIGKTLRRHRNAAMVAGVGILMIALVFAYFSLLAPYFRKRSALAGEEQLLLNVISEKKAVEAEAAEVIRRANAAFESKDYAGCAEAVQEAFDRFGPYSGRCPDVPPLAFSTELRRTPRLAEAFARYRLPLVEAAFLLADARRVSSEVEQEIGACARAYYEAVHEEGGRSSAHAAEALDRLGWLLFKTGKTRHARDAFAKVIIRYRNVPASGHAAFGLARCLEVLELFEEAIPWLEKSAKDGRLDREERAYATEALELYSALLPMRSFEIGAIPLAAGDVDMDGTDELVMVGQSSMLLALNYAHGNPATVGTATFRKPAPGESGTISFAAAVADLDGDGRNEVALAWAMPEKTEGSVSVFELEGNSLVQRSSDPCPAFCMALKTADVDGDGRVELCVGLGYFLREFRAYSYGTEKGLSLLVREPVGNDIVDLEVGDFVPAEPGAEVVMAVGAYSGYFVGLAKPDLVSGRLRPLAQLAKRTSGNCIRLSTDPLRRDTLYVSHGEDTTYTAFKQGTAESCLPLGVQRCVIGADGFSATEALDRPAGLRTDPNASRTGDVSAAALNGETIVGCISNARVGRCATLYRTRKGASESGCEPVRLLSGLLDMVLWAQLDDDPAPELCLVQTSAPPRLKVLGLGPRGPAADLDAALAPYAASLDSGEEPLVSCGSDLMALGCFGEACRVFETLLARKDDPKTRLLLADCLYEKGDLDKAADAYGETSRRFPGQAGTVAVVRQARTLTRARRWAEARTALEKLGHQSFLRSDEAEVVQTLLRQCKSALSLQYKTALLAEHGPPLYCDNPLAVDLTDKRLRLRSNPRDVARCAFPVDYDGGPFCLSMGLTLDSLDWSVRFRVSVANHLWPVEGIEQVGEPGEEDMAISLVFASQGITSRPQRTAALSSSGAALTRGGFGDIPVEVGTAYILRLTYLPDAERAWFDIEDPRTGSVRTEELALGRNLPRGKLFIVFDAAVTVNSMDFVGECRVEDLAISTSSPTGSGEGRPANAWMGLLEANGLFAHGKPKESVHRCDEIIGALAGDQHFVRPVLKERVWAESRLFRGLALERAAASVPAANGTDAAVRLEEHARSIIEAFRHQPAHCLDLVAFFLPSAGEGEKELVAKAFSQAFMQEPDSAVERLMDELAARMRLDEQSKREVQESIRAAQGGGAGSRARLEQNIVRLVCGAYGLGAGAEFLRGTPFAAALKKEAELEELRCLLDVKEEYGLGLEKLRGLCDKYPDDIDVLNSAAWHLVTLADAQRRDNRTAAGLAEKAVNLCRALQPPADVKTAMCLDTLAVATAALGGLDRAVVLLEEAVQLSKGSPLEQEFVRRLEEIRRRTREQ